MTKRQITPYKGGRSARLEVRIKPGLKYQLKVAAERDGCTVADIIERLIKEYDFFNLASPERNE